MQTLVDDLKYALEYAPSELQELADALNEQASTYQWQANYPIAMVHTQERVDNADLLETLRSLSLLDRSGLTPAHPSHESLAILGERAPQALQRASLVCLNADTPLTFTHKRDRDYWKKLANVDHIETVIEISKFSEDDNVCRMEDRLREMIRKRKEVSALKSVPFIWIALTDNKDDVYKVVRHYFDNVQQGTSHSGKHFTIAWAPTLKSINMRYFVCPPA